MPNLGKELLNLLRLTIFSPLCHFCQAGLVNVDELLFCRDCMGKILPLPPPLCSHCGKQIAESGCSDRPVCGECLVDPSPYRRHVSFSSYTGLLREAIILYKYRQLAYLKWWLAHLLTQSYFERVCEPIDWVVPVPADRGRRRGFNPVAGVAGVLARNIAAPLAKNLLVKVKKCPPQVMLTQAQRKKNLRGAFALKKPVGRVVGKRILLVDDVYTTGTTIKTCARVLTAAGGEVVAITLARSR